MRLKGLNRPVYRIMLAGIGAAGRPLSNMEIFDFYARHADAKRRAQSFEDQVRRSGYDQTKHQNYAIPKWGIAVADRVYGNVVIFPNAAGILKFTGNVSAAEAAEINKPAYESPAGGSLLDDFLGAGQNAGQGLSSLVEMLPWIIAGVVVVNILPALTRR